MKVKKNVVIVPEIEPTYDLTHVKQYPTKEELYNHLANSGDILYGSTLYLNYDFGKLLKTPDNKVIINVSTNNRFVTSFKRSKFGEVVTLAWKLELITLVFVKPSLTIY